MPDAVGHGGHKFQSPREPGFKGRHGSLDVLFPLDNSVQDMRGVGLSDPLANGAIALVLLPPVPDPNLQIVRAPI